MNYARPRVLPRSFPGRRAAARAPAQPSQRAPTSEERALASLKSCVKVAGADRWSLRLGCGRASGAECAPGGLPAMLRRWSCILYFRFISDLYCAHVPSDVASAVRAPHVDDRVSSGIYLSRLPLRPPTVLFLPMLLPSSVPRTLTTLHHQVFI